MAAEALTAAAPAPDVLARLHGILAQVPDPEIPVAIARDRNLPKRKVIILHYTERMLPSGKNISWPIVTLPGGRRDGPPPPQAPPTVRELPAVGTIVRVSTPPDVTAPYPCFIVKLYVKDLANLTGQRIGTGDGVVHLLAMHNRKLLPIANAKVGGKLTARLTSWETVEKKYGSIQSGSLDDIKLELKKPLYWGEIAGQPVLTAHELSKIGQEDDRQAR